MMARKKKRSTLWDVLLKYLSGVVYFISCFNPLHYLPQSITDAIKGRWAEALLGVFQTESSKKRQLLRWVQERVPDKHARDWTGSWSDGTLLCALVEALVPGTCPRYDLLNPSQGLNNARLGLKLAERNLGVAQLLAPEEISDSRLQTSDRLARYVSRLRQASMRMEKNNSQSKRVLTPQVSLEDTVVKDICTVSGSGLTVAEVGREATFHIFARSATIVDFEVQIKVPTGQVTSERVRQRAGLSVETFNQIFLEHRRKQMMQARANQKARAKQRREQDADKLYLGFACTHEGFFQVGYTPKKAGFHLITVLWMGSPVEGCPFRVRAQAPSVEQNRMVQFQDEQERPAPKAARQNTNPARESTGQADVRTDDRRKGLVKQISGSGSESGAPVSEDAYSGGTYRRRVVRQPSGGSDSSTQEPSEKKKTLSRQSSRNQDQSDSEVSEGAFRRRVIRQESGGSVEISDDSETTEARRGGQRAAKMERQNSASGIVTKRKVLNIIVMGEDISDASRRASIFKTSSSQGSLVSQQSGEDHPGKEAKNGRSKDVEENGRRGGTNGKTVCPSIEVCPPGQQRETPASAIEAMSNKLSSEVLVDSFGELAGKVWSEIPTGNTKEPEDDAHKVRRRTFTKQSSLIPYLKEEGPGVDPLKAQDTSQDSGIPGSKNTRQKLVHQSSLIPYLKENGESDEADISCANSAVTSEAPRNVDHHRTSLPTQTEREKEHVLRKPVATASRARTLPRQSSLVPYMRSASDVGLPASLEESPADRYHFEIHSGPSSTEGVPLQEISKDDVAWTTHGESTTTTRDTDVKSTSTRDTNVKSTTTTRDTNVWSTTTTRYTNVKSMTTPRDGHVMGEKRPASSTPRRLVKQSSLIPYMKSASVLSETSEGSKSILESFVSADSFIGSEDHFQGEIMPQAGPLIIDEPSTYITSETKYNQEHRQPREKLLSLQEFLAMEPPNDANSSFSKGEGEMSIISRPIPITDDTLMSLNEFLSLSTFEQMQAINLMQKRTHQTKAFKTEERKDLDTSVEGTTEETLLSLKEFLALKIQDSSDKSLPKDGHSDISEQTEMTRPVSDDTLITLKEFLSLRDIAERGQSTSAFKETTQPQHNSGGNPFNDVHIAAKVRSSSEDSFRTSQDLPEPTAEDSNWRENIHTSQNPFVTNLLSINREQGERRSSQDDLLILDMDSLGTGNERDTNSPKISIIERTSSEQRSGRDHLMRAQKGQGKLNKEGEITVVHDLIDIGSDDTTVRDAAVLDADTGESSKAGNQVGNASSRRPGQSRAALKRQSSLVPYLKQAEEEGIPTLEHKESLEHKEFACGVITEMEDRENLTKDRPSVSTLVQNWEGMTKSADNSSLGQLASTDVGNGTASNGNIFPVASNNTIVGKASLEQPFNGVEAIVFGENGNSGDAFAFVANVQIGEEQGSHMGALDMMINQLNHVESPVTSEGSLMYDSDLENMDMTQDWIIVDTDPNVQPKDIPNAAVDKGIGRRVSLRYRSEILVEIVNENPRKPPIANEEAKDRHLDVGSKVGKENVGAMSPNVSEPIVSQRREHQVKSGSERKLSFMKDDGNFPSLFVTTIDDHQGDDVHNNQKQHPTPLSSNEGTKLTNNQTSFGTASSLLMVAPKTGTGSDVTAMGSAGDQVSCHWSVASVEPTYKSSAIRINPARNSAVFLPPQGTLFNSISPSSQQEVGRPGTTYRTSMTLQVNQDSENRTTNPEIHLPQADSYRDGRRRRQIRESFRKAVVDKVEENFDGPVGDCIERDAMDSGYVDPFYPRVATRVDCSHKSLQVHSHQIRKETGYHDSPLREDMRSRQGALGGVSSIRNLLRSVDEKVSELSDIASEVMHNSSQHRNSLAEALRAAARKTSGETGLSDADDEEVRKTTRQSTDDSGISDVTIYVDGKGPYTWQERHNISSLEDRIPYWLLNNDDSDSNFSPCDLRIPNQLERAWKSDSECVTPYPNRTSIGPQDRRRSNASLPDTESMNDFTAQLAHNDTFANMRWFGRRGLAGESASLQAGRQSWAGFPHIVPPRRNILPPRTDGYEAGDEPNEEDEEDLGSRKADGPSRSRVLASRILAFGPGLDHGFVGAKNNFQVSTRDAGNGAINVSLVGPRKNTVAEVNVIYTGDDLYEVIYDVTQPGYYVLSVKWMDRNIPDSPFIVKVSY